MRPCVRMGRARDGAPVGPTSLCCSGCRSIWPLARASSPLATSMSSVWPRMARSVQAGRCSTVLSALRRPARP
eukprot:10200727-Lingulodinium_polyedra.AAC.1